ncbi:MAG: hypothetical protein AAF513_11580 [Pseudomonadota bacterium]
MAASSPSLDEFTKTFFAEDKLICERVQLGMHTRVGTGGKLVDMERVVVDIHHYLTARLGGADVTSRFEAEAAQSWRGTA